MIDKDTATAIKKLKAEISTLQNEKKELEDKLASGDLVQCSRSAKLLIVDLIDNTPFLSGNIRAALKKILALLRDPSK